jgi:hypothetical protein
MAEVRPYLGSTPIFTDRQRDMKIFRVDVPYKMTPPPPAITSDEANFYFTVLGTMMSLISVAVAAMGLLLTA